jgi:hypothetical protein
MDAHHIFYIFQWLLATLAALKNSLKSTESLMERILQCCEVQSPKENSINRHIKKYIWCQWFSQNKEGYLII